MPDWRGEARGSPPPFARAGRSDGGRPRSIARPPPTDGFHPDGFHQALGHALVEIEMSRFVSIDVGVSLRILVHLLAFE
jgi:hypothetical protein